MKKTISMLLAVCIILTGLPIAVNAAFNNQDSLTSYLEYQSLDLTQQPKDISADAPKLTSFTKASVTMYVKFQAVDQMKKVILSLSGQSGSRFEVYIKDSELTFEYASGGATVSSGVFNCPEIKAGRWSAVTLTFNGSDAVCFVDETKVGTVPCTATPASAGAFDTGFVGASNAGGLNLMNGNISNISFYPAILSDTYILDTIGADVQKLKLENSADAYRSDTQKLFVGTSIDPSMEEPMDGAMSFRIPSIINMTTDDPYDSDVLIASINKSNCGSDWGDIDVAVRRSYDNGKTWTTPIDTVLDLPTNTFSTNGNDYYSAFAIDPMMVRTAGGDAMIVVDVFPESKGLHDTTMLDNEKSAYVTVNGQKYLALYSEKSKLDGGKDVNTSTAYTVREQGWVYAPDGSRTNYYIPQNHNAEYNLETTGDMYYCVGEPDYIDATPPMYPTAPQGDEDVYVGNIYLSKGKGTFSLTSPTFVQKKIISKENGYSYNDYETDPAPLRVAVCSYVWCLRSSDNGVNWSHPLDITPMIRTDSAKNDNSFLGVGPGVGTVLKYQSDPSKNGRILLPLYTTGTTYGAACAYSDDDGYTWKRCTNDYTNNCDESQFVEFSNGTVMCVGRPAISWSSLIGTSSTQPVTYSYDGGETWSTRSDKSFFTTPKCQKSLLDYPLDPGDGSVDGRFAYPEGMEKGSQYILSVHPTQKGRSAGEISLGKVNADNSVTWQYHRNLNGSDSFAYSTIAVLANGNIGIFYEATGGDMRYLEVSLGWIMNSTSSSDKTVLVQTPQYQSTSLSIENHDGDAENISQSDVLKFTVAYSDAVFARDTTSLKFTFDGIEREASLLRTEGGTAVYSYTVKKDDTISSRSTVNVYPGEIRNLEGVYGKAVLCTASGPVNVEMRVGVEIGITPLTYVQGMTSHDNGTAIVPGSAITVQGGASIVGQPECITAGANIKLTKSSVQGVDTYAISGTANTGNLGFKVTYDVDGTQYSKIVYTYVRAPQRNAHAIAAYNYQLFLYYCDNQTLYTLLNSEGYGGSGYWSLDSNTMVTSKNDFSGASASGSRSYAVVRADVYVDKSVTQSLSDVLQVKGSLARNTNKPNLSEAICVGPYQGNTGSTSISSTSYTTPAGNTFYSNNDSSNLGSTKGGSADNAVRSINGPLVSDQFRLLVNTRPDDSITMVPNYYTYQEFDIDLHVVDKDALRKAVNSVLSGFPQEREYTSRSYQTFLLAYEQACMVLNSDTVGDQSEVDSAANKLISAVSELDSLTKEADYTAVNAAVQRAKEMDSSLYTNFDAVTQAVENVVYGLKASEQDRVDAMAAAILTAISQLNYRGADYTSVEKAIASIPSDLSIYTAESVEKLNLAVAKIDYSKNITQQDEVEKMAQLILDCISSLEYKGADYTAVEQAIKKAEALNPKHYYDFSGVTAAINNVVYGLAASEQPRVDAMAASILEAVSALKEYPVLTMNVSGMGKVSVDSQSIENGGTIHFRPGQELRLSAQADEGYEFLCWTDSNGKIVSDVDLCFVVYEESVTVSAVFIKKTETAHRVYFFGADDTIINIQIVEDCEDAVPPEVIAPEGYKFAGWLGDPTNIVEDTYVYAYFIIDVDLLS